LNLLDFDIKDNQVTARLPWGTVLSTSEQCFIDLVKNKGPIVTFVEVAEILYENHLSLPAATSMLRKSPIVEKIEMGLYKSRNQLRA
jgi:hypothetical protein